MKELLKALIPYVRPFSSKAIWALLLALPYSGIKGIQVWLVKHIVDVLVPGSSLYEALLYAGALLGTGLLNYPCRFFHFYLMRYVVDRATCLIRNDIYQKLQTLPLSYFTKSKSGKLVSNVLNDSLILSQGFRNGIDLIREPLTAAIMLCMALYSDWQLTLVILFVAPLFLFIFIKSGRLVKENQEGVQEHLADMTHNVSEGMSGQKVAKAFNLQSYVLSRFKSAQDDYFRYQMKTTVVEENAHPLVELVGAIAFAGVILFAHHRIQTGDTTTGDFFSFVTALALMMDPLRKYGQANVKMGQAHAAGERLFELLKLEGEKDTGTIDSHQFSDGISIKDLRFSYEEQPVLRNFTLDIKKGQKIGIVGLSGSGKSTLIHLLLRLYPLQSGKIAIDGHSIDEYRLKQLRDYFGLVSQDIFLFHDTILENLTLGHQYEDSKIWEALEIAGVKEFVAQLPKGLDTVIGDRGTRLSGGQAQRITIARAFLKNPDILLFDEATSGLDSASEKVVQQALDRLSQNKTIIAVAHRLSTIQNYDKIIVLHEGEVVESGRHEELMNEKGHYYKLYQLGNKSQDEN